ncbi:hypothetical protein DKX38_009448 [Salix brachista]|uniref:ubiquitinyl hydrolase 1 n=1 Tax=Salix brachista TaxID=2182728 RepID=A0A5N5MAR5_9ROSI|nr:hypothetical protein DKX38_009448 [Salix brachista]
MEMEGVCNGGMLYHEVQEAKLCAVHCVNTVLQGPFFSEFDLAALASELDSKERQMMQEGNVSSSSAGDYLSVESHNVSLGGDFSIQVAGLDEGGNTHYTVLINWEHEYVKFHFSATYIDASLLSHKLVLQKALEVWDLQVIAFDSPVAEQAQIDPDLENAFICHLHDHWFCIRKVNGEWYNFDSLYAAPQHLSKFYLAAYMDSLKNSGWSIFLVRGNFPKEFPIASSEVPNGYGQWVSPEDAERITKSCNTTESPQTIDSTQQGPDPYQEILLEMEDQDLKAAIAASLMESSQAVARVETGSPQNDKEDTKDGNEDSKDKNTQ